MRIVYEFVFIEYKLSQHILKKNNKQKKSFQINHNVSIVITIRGLWVSFDILIRDRIVDISQHFIDSTQQILFIFFQIRQQHENIKQNIKFNKLLEYHQEIQVFKLQTKLLEEYKSEKIKFIVIIKKNQEFKENHKQNHKSYKNQTQTQSTLINYIEISSQPIYVSKGSIVFLVVWNWQLQTHTKISTYGVDKSARYSSSLPLGNARRHQQKIKNTFSNFVYLISSILYLESGIQEQFMNLIRVENRNSFKHKNILKIFLKNQININIKITGKRHAILSTAAQTKFQRSMNQSEDEQIFGSGQNTPPLNFNKQEKRSFKSPLLSSKNEQNNSKMPILYENNLPNYKQNSSSVQNNSVNLIKQRLFSRVASINIDQEKLIQTIIRDSREIESFPQFLCLKFIHNLSSLLLKNAELPLIEQFYYMNNKELIEEKVNEILQNYRNSVELQFSQMTQTSIQQITDCLKIFFDQSIQQFYSTISSNSFPVKLQQQYYTKLLSQINQIEKKLFTFIRKGKKQSIERRMSLCEDQDYLRGQLKGNTKFQNFIGERTMQDLEIGFNLYRGSLQNRISGIFQQLIQDNPFENYNHSQSHKKYSRTNNMTKNQFNQNIQKRIQILASQKRNIEQCLHFQQSLQQNLMEYLKGIEAKSGQAPKRNSEQETMRKQLTIQQVNQD